MDNNKIIQKNYLLNLIYQILLIIIPVVTTPYLSRVLLADGIGTYSYSYSIVTYFILLANFGYSYYAQREIVKLKGDKYQESKFFWELIIIRFLTVILSVIIYLTLGFNNIFENKLLMSIFLIDIISVGFDITFYFQGREEFEKIITVNIIVKVINVIAIFLFVKTKDDLGNYALCQSFSVFFSNFLLWIFIFKKIGFINIKQLHIFRHIKPSLYLFIPTIAISIYRTLDKTLIGIITNDPLENGYYEQAEKIIRVALTIITALGSVMISRNATLIKENNIKQVKINIYNAINFVLILSLPMIAGTFIISDLFAPWFLGSGYEPVSNLMKVHSFIFIIVGLSNVLGLQYLVAFGKDRQYGTCIILGALINLVCNLLLIPNYGAMGASIGTIIAELTITITMFICSRKMISLKKIIKNNYKYFIATVIMLLMGTLCNILFKDNILLMFVNIVICAITYLISLIILKDKFVVNFLKNLKNKLKHN